MARLVLRRCMRGQILGREFHDIKQMTYTWACIMLKSMTLWQYALCSQRVLCVALCMMYYEEGDLLLCRPPPLATLQYHLSLPLSHSQTWLAHYARCHINTTVSTGWTKKKWDLKNNGHNSSEIHQKEKKLVCFRKFSLNVAVKIGGKMA